MTNRFDFIIKELQLEHKEEIYATLEMIELVIRTKTVKQFITTIENMDEKIFTKDVLINLLKAYIHFQKSISDYTPKKIDEYCKELSDCKIWKIRDELTGEMIDTVEVSEVIEIVSRSKW